MNTIIVIVVVVIIIIITWNDISFYVVEFGSGREIKSSAPKHLSLRYTPICC